MPKKRKNKETDKRTQEFEDRAAYAAFANSLYPDQIDINEAQEVINKQHPRSE